MGRTSGQDGEEMWQCGEWIGPRKRGGWQAVAVLKPNPLPMSYLCSQVNMSLCQ